MTKRKKCIMCNTKVFDLDSHIRTHTKERPFGCNLCTFTSSIFSNFRRHISQVHEKKRTFSCIFCSKAFFSKHGKDIHLRRHIIEKPHTCNICSETFCGKLERDGHLRSHTQEKLAKCKLCMKLFATNSNLKTHEQVHESKRPRPHKCGHCKKGFTLRSLLLQHVLQVHSSKIVKCHHCKVKLKGPRYLERHYKIVHQKLECYHVCLFCQRRMTTRSHLFEHLLVHVQEKPFPCQFCQDSFRGPRDRQQHVVRRHSGVRRLPHACIFCSKMFLTAPELVRHICGHINEKPFLCQHCGASFGSTGDRFRHIRRLHGDGKAIATKIALKWYYPNLLSMHQCTFCSKSFNERTTLYRHILSHVEEKPFFCKFCECSFTNQGNRAKHLRQCAAKSMDFKSPGQGR